MRTFSLLIWFRRTLILNARAAQMDREYQALARRLQGPRLVRALLVLLAMLGAAPLTAAPIVADVSLDGGIHLSSDQPFTVAGFWSPEPTFDPTLDNAFALPLPHFTGPLFVLHASLPLQGCGRFQVDAFVGNSIWDDAWSRIGLFGQVLNTGLTCDPPVCVACEVTGRSSVPEPSVWLLLAGGLAWALWRKA